MASSISRSEWYAEMRKQCAGEPMQVALLEHYETRDPNDGAEYPSVLPACPPWCERAEQNHDYSDRHDDGAFLRYHEWVPAGMEVDAWIGQPEYNRDGVVSYGPTLISVGPTNEDVDSAFARRCAAQWTALADKLDEINGQAQR